MVTSICEKQSFRRVDTHDKQHTVPFRNLISSPRSLRMAKEVPDGAAPVQSMADKKGHKRSCSLDTSEEVPAKFQRRTEEYGGSSDQKAIRLSADEQQNPVGKEMAVASSAEVKQPQKPKRPAENLTIGTLFDLASHLDAARKKTRREFDSDLVTIVRKSNEGSCLLHTRPEFNSSETSSSADNQGDGNTVPLSLFHSDVDYALRLGTLIAANIGQHVDMKKLEHTAKSVSHRLQRGMAKTNEREIVRRPAPVLISTVPRTAANIRDKVQLTNSGINSTSKMIHHQSAGHIAAKYDQNMLHSLNAVQSCSVNSGFGNGLRTVNNGSGRHIQVADSTGSSSVCQFVTSDTGSTDTVTSRRIVVSKNTNTHLHLRPENLSNSSDGKLLKNNNRFDEFDCV